MSVRLSMKDREFEKDYIPKNDFEETEKNVQKMRNLVLSDCLTLRNINTMQKNLSCPIKHYREMNALS